MKKLILLFMIAAVMISCNKDETESPAKDIVQEELITSPFNDYQFTGDLPVTSLRASGKWITKSIIFHESSGTSEFDYTVIGCAPDYPYLTIDGDGHATLLGLFTVQNFGCFSGTDPIFGIMTAANGDMLNSVLLGADETGDPFYYYYYIYNGTGRFEGVNGEVTMYGTMDYVFEGGYPIGGDWNLEGYGTINFPK